MTWTQFWDMNSGGGLKEKWDKIYIEAPQEEACVIFYNRFGHSPHRVTCTCCGADYSISTNDSLDKLTEFHRRNYQPLAEYLQSEDSLFIYYKDIKDEERKGKVPSQGYVWID